MACPKVSIIVPVYNCQSYIEECVRSVLTQSVADFELILVNDGSTDESGLLCDALAKEDSRIRVFHKENGGAASARNLGLDNASGDYISFIDADDTVRVDFLERLLDAVYGGAEMAMCDYIKYTRDSSFPYSCPIRGGAYSRSDIKNELFGCLVMFDNLEFPPTISNCVCLFKRELLKRAELRYPIVRLCEDSYFGSVALYNADGFVYLKGETLYNYRFNPSSVTNSLNPKRWESFLTLNECYESYFADKEPIFGRQIKYNMLYFALNQLSYIRKSSLSSKEKRAAVREIMHCERLVKALKGTKLPDVSWKLKSAVLLVKYRMACLYMLIFGRK